MLCSNEIKNINNLSGEMALTRMGSNRDCEMLTSLEYELLLVLD